MAQALDAAVAPAAPCARCGADADFEIASLWLCVACYHIAGSTCAGIGRGAITPGAGAEVGAATAAPEASPMAVDGAPGAADQVC
jgi:hypothetical protein